MINNDLQFNYYGIIGNELIETKDIDSNISSVYSVLRTVFYDMSKEVAIFNLYTLYEIFNAASTTQRNPIKNAIQYLIAEKYIELYTYDCCDLTEFNASNVSQLYRCVFLNDNKQQDNEVTTDDPHTNGYTKISCLNIHNILSFLKDNNINIHKHKLIRYYLYIARRCSNSDLAGYVSMDTINKMIGISKQTCAEYNEILELDVGAIFYNNEYGRIDNNGNFKNGITIFGHRNILKYNENSYLTKEAFFNYVEYYSNKNKVVLLDKYSINNKRSDSMRKVWQERKKIIND